MEPRKDNLTLQPDEILLNISESFRPSDFINLSKTSARFLPTFFAENKLSLNLLHQLLCHAALGELEDAEALWKLFPDLLTCRGTVHHPNRIYKNDENPVDIPVYTNPGRYKYIDRTFWQILLMNEEYEEAEKAGKLMTEEQKKKQFLEIFPDGEIKKHDWDTAKAIELLNQAFNAVIKDVTINASDLNKMNETTKNALYDLYEYVRPKPEHQIGLVFDANFYVYALKLYHDKDEQFTNWHRCAFWCIRIEEWLAGCLGTGYLRPHAQGIGNSLTRAGCVLPDHSSYFAFRREPHSLPGIHFFVAYLKQYSSMFVLARKADVIAGIEDYVAQKQQKRRLYAAISATDNPPLSKT